MGNESKVLTPKVSKRFHRFFYDRSPIREIGFYQSEIDLLNLYRDYEELNYNLEILPRGSDGSYFHEHLVGFSEITKIVRDAKRYHETGELGRDYTFQDQQKGINQYARDPKTMKDITDQPTARTQSDKSIYQPAYRVSFNSPKPNEKPIIQHSNELSLDEMRKIRDQLKKNPKSYVPKTPKNEKKARRSFKQ